MPHSDSDSIEVVFPIRGVWIHDPDDPEGTIRSYFYGANQRGDQFDNAGIGTFYVGNEDPVFEFGDASAFSADVTVDVVHGPAYNEELRSLRAFAKMKKALWFRDNRGRAIFGNIGSFKTSDTAWGSTVSFTVTQAHRSVITVS